MKLFSKFLFLFIFLILGFTAKTAFAATRTISNAGGNWNAVGAWTGGVVPLAGDIIVATPTSGNLVINVSTAAIAYPDFTGYTGTLSGTGQLSVRGVTAATSTVTFSTGMTVTWTGVLALTPVSTSAHIGITTNGKLINRLTTGGSAANIILNDNLSFQLTKGAYMSLGGGSSFNMNGFTISGYNAQNRLMIQSNAVGTARTIIPNGGTFAYADFNWITSSTAIDLSAITGLSGDALGNTNITFTSATTTYWVGDTGSWENATEWASSSGGTAGTGRAPLPQDSCIFDANSFSGAGFTTTTNPRSCVVVDFSTVGTDNPILDFGNSGGASSWTTYGDFLFDSGSTIANRSGITLYFYGTGNIDLQGATIVTRPVVMYGNHTLLNDFISSGTILNNYGTLDAGIYDVTGTTFGTANSVSAIVNMGSGTWTVTGTGAVWTMGYNSVINAQTSTINVSNTTATAKTITTSNKTFYAVTFSGRNIITTGNATYNTLNLLNAGANGFRPTAGSTTTITSLITTNATTTAAYSLASSTSMTALAELKFTGGTVCGLDYMNFVRILATPPGAWTVGTNSTSTGSSGLTFTYTACSAPSGSSSTPAFIDFSFLERDTDYDF